MDQRRTESLDSIAELSWDEIAGCVALVDPLTDTSQVCGLNKRFFGKEG